MACQDTTQHDMVGNTQYTTINKKTITQQPTSEQLSYTTEALNVDMLLQAIMAAIGINSAAVPSW